MVPLPDSEDWQDTWVIEQAHRTGLPDPPTDRIWLLRSPWPRMPVTVIYEIVWSLAERIGGGGEISQVYEVARDVLTGTRSERWMPARARRVNCSTRGPTPAVSARPQRR
jgi:hypothetical protein